VPMHTLAVMQLRGETGGMQIEAPISPASST
jgi:hypothetical protein